MTIVVDASAVLAILKNERGADVAASLARGGLLSTVNLVEVRSKLTEAVTDVEAAIAMLARLEIVIAPFTAVQARIAADLWPQVKGRDVSLADRACLALAIDQRAVLVTADRPWTALKLPVELRSFR